MNKKDFMLCIFSVVLLKQIYMWLISRGVGVHFNNHRPGKCHIVPGIECGSEKISMTSNGLAFITSNYQEMTNCHKPNLKGKLYSFDFNNPDDGVKQLEVKGMFNTDTFNPHGMDILEDLLQGIVHIYVVNHANHTESIEVFRYHTNKPGEVTYLRTITDEKFVCLNDIAVINQNEFYVTNFAKYCYSSIQPLFIAEMVFGFNTANILYHRQGKTRVGPTGSVFNGIATDFKHIFVVSSGSNMIHVYKKLDGGKLKREKMIRVEYNPDNVAFDRVSGDLYVGRSKNVLNLIALSDNRTEYSSASAVKISQVDGSWKNKAQVTEILHDSGKNFIHGVSSVVHYKKAYLFGTVFHKLAYCSEV